ncbi:MAG: CRTAC1 family protein, partial [Actinomycetia bacterium]|nr:CRTAC1 family protein [Actinomycetes bacterium]
VQAGGPDLDTYEAGLGIPDMVWRGSAEGFDDRTAELGFGDTDNHVGLATADLDGDGFLDVVLAGPGTTPDLWMNHCSEAAWTRIDLVGPALNREGYGARVEVTAGGTTRLRELTASRGPGQGPSEVHLGLGDAETIDRLVVTWPDGLVFKIEDVPVKRVVTVWHPKSESTD